MELRSLPCTVTGCRDCPTWGAVTEGSPMATLFPCTVGCGACQDTRSPAANATPPISMVDTSIPMPTHTHVLCLTIFPSYAGRCRGEPSMVSITLFPCNRGRIFHDGQNPCKNYSPCILQ